MPHLGLHRHCVELGRFDTLTNSKRYTDAKHGFVLNALRTLNDCYDPY